MPVGRDTGQTAAPPDNSKHILRGGLKDNASKESDNEAIALAARKARVDPYLVAKAHARRA